MSPARDLEVQLCVNQSINPKKACGLDGVSVAQLRALGGLLNASLARGYFPKS